LKVGIGKVIVELGKESPFYTYILMYCDLIESSRVRTFKLRVSSRGRIQLLYNPQMVKNKPLWFVKGLLKHEIMHIVNKHILIKPGKSKEKVVWDLAMDAAINQYIPELYARGIPLNVLIHEGCSTDNERFFVIPPEFMPGETAECYHDWILEEMSKSKKVDLELLEDLSENTDSHDEFGNIELSKEIVEDLLNQVISEVVSKSHDRVPPALKEIVEAVLDLPKIDWKTAIRRFAGSAILGERYRTPLRPNRRYEDQPGWRREYLARIAVIMDTSGSIIEEEYNAFLSELEVIARLVDTRLWLIQVDEDVRMVAEYTRGSWKNFEILGKGGTDLQPAIDYAQRNLRVEGMIVFTDGYVDVPLVKRRVLFVLSSKSSSDFAREARQMYGPGAVVVLS